MQNLATTLISIQPKKISTESLAKQLRLHKIPIFTRIQNNAVLVDPRTFRESDDGIIAEALIEILNK